MPKPNTGPKLKLNKFGIHEITWTEDGRSKRVSTRTANLQEAQKILGGFLLEQERDKANNGRLKIAELIDLYDEAHVAEKVTDKKRQRRILERLKDHFGELFADELTPEDLASYKRKRRAHRFDPPKGEKMQRGQRRVTTQVAESTLRRELNAFTAVINFAINSRKIDNRSVPEIELPDNAPSKDIWLEREQATKILTAAQGRAKRLTRAYRFTAIALGTARRRTAIEKLKWFQVDFKRRTIDFRKKNEPETKKRRGVSPISDWLLPILERAYQEKISEFVLDNDSSVYRPFKKAAVRAGFPDVTPHTLRHTWGTWAAQSGRSMWEIAGVLGCTIQTAEKNYLHHCPQHLRGVVNGVAPADLSDAIDAVSDALNDTPDMGVTPLSSVKIDQQ